MKYTTKPADPYKNIEYGSTEKEEFTLFFYEEKKQYPIQVEMIGVTNPDKKYYISRKHPHYHVIEYVDSGEGFVEVDGKIYKVKEGDVYILTSGIAHKYGADKKNPYRKIWINCFSGFLNEFLVTYGLNGKVVFNDCQDCKKYFLDLLEYSKNYPFNDDFSIKVSRIMFNLLLTLAEKNQLNNGFSEIAQKTKQILDNAIYRKITIEQLCDEVNVSKSQLCRDFKKFFNISPYQYLIDKKIAMAKQLLYFTNMKIGEISSSLCFSDEYNFSNMFKKKVGVSPLEFRKTKGNYV